MARRRSTTDLIAAIDRATTARNGSLDEAIRLVEEGADVHQVDPRDGWSVFQKAVAYVGMPRGLELVRRMIAKGTDVNASCNGRGGPLHFAAHFGFHEAMRVLLDAGADVTAQNDQGETALFWAAVCAPERAAAVQDMLLAAGADPHHRDHHGRTAVEAAYVRGEGSMASVARLDGVLLRLDAQTSDPTLTPNGHEGGERPRFRL